jgi:hypothetical protein
MTVIFMIILYYEKACVDAYSLLSAYLIFPYRVLQSSLHVGPNLSVYAIMLRIYLPSSRKVRSFPWKCHGNKTDYPLSSFFKRWIRPGKLNVELTWYSVTMRLSSAAALVISFLFVLTIITTVSKDFNQDLGRHLKIGEIILETKQIPQTNLFSYTNPSFPFINHHWLSEVVFFSLTSLLGVTSMAILKIILIMSAVGIGVCYGIRRVGIQTTLFSLLLFSPLFLERAHIRPEMFGYLFFAILLYMVLTYPKHPKLILITPVIMVLWTNMHISFVFGLFLLILLLAKLIILQRSLRDIVLVAGGILATLINPHGLTGALYPFTIFNEYGYQIAENQSLLFLNSLTFNVWIKYFFILTPIIVLCLLVHVFKQRWTAGIILLTFFAVTFFQIRHMPFFVIAAIPLCALSLRDISHHLQIKKVSGTVVDGLLSLLMGVCMIFFLTGTYSNTFDMNTQFGIGFQEDAKAATDFVKKHNLPKNIFNNFDVGGYLIYRLYPDYHLFVDNRPEAYPAKFFQEVYIPMQLDTPTRTMIFKKYNIQTIITAHTDQTDWGRSLILNTYKDTSWKLVFADKAILIFTRNSALPDLRNNAAYFERLIADEENYMQALRLADLFSLMEQPELQAKAFIKAERLNPNSCIIQRSNYINTITSQPLLFAEPSTEKSWYCF